MLTANTPVTAVRVINCDGSAQSSAVIAGLDWLAQNYKLPAVASMSLGSDSPNQALDDAVTAVINLGITAVIAAGNYNQGQRPCTAANLLPQGQTFLRHGTRLSKQEMGLNAMINLIFACYALARLQGCSRLGIGSICLFS